MSAKIWPILAFLLFAAIGYGAREAIGSVYGAAEARDLLEALSRAGLYLGSATATASATTLALMLTLIGMLRKLDTDFDKETYRRVTLNASLATASLMMSLLVLLAFVLPVGEFDELPAGWYTMLYEVLFAGAVIMVGLLAATVMVTYLTVRRVVGQITPGENV